MPDPTPSADPGEVTRLLQEAGDRPEAAVELLPIVYDELRALARARMRSERPDHTLQPTALVHEAYARLVGANGESDPGWNDRAHFFRAAAESMRRILVDHARRHGSLKRGGDRRAIPLDAVDLARPEDAGAIVDLDAALARLAEEDPRAAEIVTLRFFGGLSVSEVVQALDVSERTVMREWAFARARLAQLLSESAETIQ